VLALTCASRRNIILDLDDGRAQLVEAKAGVCRTLRSGMRVQATGSWVAASAAARAATGTPRFLVTSVTASGGLQGKPIVTGEQLLAGAPVIPTPVTPSSRVGAPGLCTGKPH
jgi:hypothetical protein